MKNAGVANRLAIPPACSDADADVAAGEPSMEPPDRSARAGQIGSLQRPGQRARINQINQLPDTVLEHVGNCFDLGSREASWLAGQSRAMQQALGRRALADKVVFHARHPPADEIAVSGFFTRLVNQADSLPPDLRCRVLDVLPQAMVEHWHLSADGLGPGLGALQRAIHATPDARHHLSLIHAFGKVFDDPNFRRACRDPNNPAVPSAVMDRVYRDFARGTNRFLSRHPTALATSRRGAIPGAPCLSTFRAPVESACLSGEQIAATVGMLARGIHMIDQPLDRLQLWSAYYQERRCGAAQRIALLAGLILAIPELSDPPNRLSAFRRVLAETATLAAAQQPKLLGSLGRQLIWFDTDPIRTAAFNDLFDACLALTGPEQGTALKIALECLASVPDARREEVINLVSHRLATLSEPIRADVLGELAQTIYCLPHGESRMFAFEETWSAVAALAPELQTDPLCSLIEAIQFLPAADIRQIHFSAGIDVATEVSPNGRPRLIGFLNRAIAGLPRVSLRVAAVHDVLALIATLPVAEQTEQMREVIAQNIEGEPYGDIKFVLLKALQRCLPRLQAEDQVRLIDDLATSATVLHEPLMQQMFEGIVKYALRMPPPVHGIALDRVSETLHLAVDDWTEASRDVLPLYFTPVLETTSVLPRDMAVNLLESIINILPRFVPSERASGRSQIQEQLESLGAEERYRLQILLDAVPV